MRKSLKIIAVIGAVITFVVIAAHLTLRGGNTTTPAQAPVQPVVPQTQPVPGSPSAGNSHPARKATSEKYSVKDAVVAAALASSQLSEAVMLPKQQMSKVVESIVIPSKQQRVEGKYLTAARAMARGLGYTNLSDAQLNANYYVVTQKYWVQSFGNKQATVWLYNITHVVVPPDQQTVQNYAVTHPGQTPQGQEYYVPSITIIRMKWLNGRWVWTGTQDPPADNVPPQKGHPTFQQAVDAYLPYLRSFRNYASLQ